MITSKSGVRSTFCIAILIAWVMGWSDVSAVDTSGLRFPLEPSATMAGIMTQHRPKMIQMLVESGAGTQDELAKLGDEALLKLLGIPRHAWTLVKTQRISGKADPIDVAWSKGLPKPAERALIAMAASATKAWKGYFSATPEREADWWTLWEGFHCYLDAKPSQSRDRDNWVGNAPPPPPDLSKIFFNPALLSPGLRARMAAAAEAYQEADLQRGVQLLPGSFFTGPYAGRIGTYPPSMQRWIIVRYLLIEQFHADVVAESKAAGNKPDASPSSSASIRTGSVLPRPPVVAPPARDPFPAELAQAYSDIVFYGSDPLDSRIPMAARAWVKAVDEWVAAHPGHVLNAQLLHSRNQTENQLIRLTDPVLYRDGKAYSEHLGRQYVRVHDEMNARGHFNLEYPNAGWATFEHALGFSKAVARLLYAHDDSALYPVRHLYKFFDQDEDGHRASDSPDKRTLVRVKLDPTTNLTKSAEEQAAEAATFRADPIWGVSAARGWFVRLAGARSYNYSSEQIATLLDEAPHPDISAMARVTLSLRRHAHLKAGDGLRPPREEPPPAAQPDAEAQP